MASVLLLTLPFLLKYLLQYPSLLYVIGLILVISIVFAYKINHLDIKRIFFLDDAGYKSYPDNLYRLSQHCKLEKTADGFIVCYNNQAFDQVIADNIHYKIGMMASLLLLIPSLINSIYPSKIEVNKQFVIIEGKQLKREGFGGFFIARTYKTSRRTIAELGYKEGFRTIAFGGAWNEEEANIVANSLNKLIGIPQDDDD